MRVIARRDRVRDRIVAPSTTRPSRTRTRVVSPVTWTWNCVPTWRTSPAGVAMRSGAPRSRPPESTYKALQQCHVIGAVEAQPRVMVDTQRE